jgi:IS4 transposase
VTETACLGDYTPDERIAVVARTEIQPGDHEWGGLTLHTTLRYDIGKRNPPTFADLVSSLSVRVSGSDFPDDRANWHHNYTGLEPWFRAHIYRIGMGWQSTRLEREFNDNPWLADRFGFDSEPSQSRLWEVFHESWPPVTQGLCHHVAERVVEQAREHGIAVPDDVFQPEDRDGESDRSEKRLTDEKMKEVWAQAKPFVMDCFGLDRAENASIPEGSFWEAHAYAGTLQDAFTEGGLDAFRVNTTRPEDQQHVARTHRHHLQKLDVESIRSMLQETARMLVARARHNGELQGKLSSAIDITKGNPWTGEIEWTDDDHPEDDYILGYKDKETQEIDYHFQWATIQIVGLDVPLVLDAIPVHRGMPRDEIVDELLGGALGIVPDLDLVMMDREFDGDDVRAACEEHGIHYLTPGKKNASERATCTRLRKAGKRVHVETQQTISGPGRKEIYLPARNTDVFEKAGEDPEDDEEDKEENRDEVRQELVADFVNVTGEDPDDVDDAAWFDDVLDDVREDKDELPGSEEDAAAYAFFKTNHPAFDTSDDDTEEELLATARGFIARYSNRWGIENGYKQIKQFRVRTTSKEHEYRYFNFAFACVLYNVWRLVDLLVKLALEDDPDYSPRVQATTFLTLAGKHIGFDPPD